MDPPTFQYFDVAIAASDKATEAVTKHLAKTEAEIKIWEVRVVRELSTAEIHALGLARGEVKPA